MRQLAAFFILIPALLFFALAFRGCAEEGATADSRRQTGYDESTSRVSNGVSPQRAEEQGALLIAGFEGLLGVGLLCTAVLLCGSPREVPQESGAPIPDRFPRRHSGEIKKARKPTLLREEKPTAPVHLRERSGRARIDELRRAGSARPRVGHT